MCLCVGGVCVVVKFLQTSLSERQLQGASGLRPSSYTSSAASQFQPSHTLAPLPLSPSTHLHTLSAGATLSHAATTATATGSTAAPAAGAAVGRAMYRYREQPTTTAALS